MLNLNWEIRVLITQLCSAYLTKLTQILGNYRITNSWYFSLLLQTRWCRAVASWAWRKDEFRRQHSRCFTVSGIWGEHRLLYTIKILKIAFFFLQISRPHTPPIFLKSSVSLLTECLQVLRTIREDQLWCAMWRFWRPWRSQKFDEQLIQMMCKCVAAYCCFWRPPRASGVFARESGQCQQPVEIDMYLLWK